MLDFVMITADELKKIPNRREDREDFQTNKDTILEEEILSKIMSELLYTQINKLSEEGMRSKTFLLDKLLPDSAKKIVDTMKDLGYEVEDKVTNIKTNSYGDEYPVVEMKISW